jgi:hypothetical protein
LSKDEMESLIGLLVKLRVEAGDFESEGKKVQAPSQLGAASVGD